MKTMMMLVRGLAIACALFSPLTASALTSRTFVSGAGVDTGTCAVTAPCRSFAFAITQTSADGEIIAVDTAGFGAVTIDKSLTIATAIAAYAGVSVSFSNGITIDAGASDVVVLRGLAINGVGGKSGISVVKAGAVRIERCLVSGFSASTQRGISFTPTSAVDLEIADSIVRGNDTGLFAVVNVAAAADSRVTVRRTRVQDSAATGLSFSNITRVDIVDSFIGHNGSGIVAVVDTTSSVNASYAIDRTTIADSGGNGILAGGSFPPRSVVHVSSSTIAGNNIGMQAGNGGFIRVMSSQINGNGVGVDDFGTGVIDTLQNNMCYGNGSSCTFTGSIPLN